ncbi:MAG: T9SS type A sorting domain-containing protein [Flavobacteriales bacterium]|nr:T9SS type A sorting domain-containing protein [Flavobacteriales bacterium]
MRINIKLTVLLVASVAWYEATAQSIAPQVLSNCGASAADANYRMDWTLGEFAIATIGNGEHRFTQGFHQPYAGTVGIEDIQRTEGNSWIWPNPAGNELNIGFATPLRPGTMVRVLSMEGKILLTNLLSPGATTAVVPVAALAAGGYLLTLDNTDGATQVHRFVKTP